MPVDTLHPDYSAMINEWAKMRDVHVSQSLIKLRGEKYLPRLSAMTDIQYDAYKSRASFVIYTKRATEAFVGMTMRKDVWVNEADSENVDGKGNDINHYVRALLREYLITGRVGTLVDLPVVDPSEYTIVGADKEDVVARFYMYHAEDIINWQTSVVNNTEVLSLVVLKEEKLVAEDEFGHEYEPQYRVLDLNEGIYRQRLYDDSNNLIATYTPIMGGEPLSFIPFEIHGGIDVQQPPMLGVADLNLRLYVQDADYQHGLHYVALPTPYVVGADPDDPNAPKTLGPTKLWWLPDGASAGMLEFTGAGLGQIATAMETTVEAIIILTSKILSPDKSSNDESALAAAIRSNAETSTLADIVYGLSIEMQRLVTVRERWNGNISSDPGVQINVDFLPSMLSGTDMLSYVTAWLNGGISYESLFEILKKGEIIKGNRLLDEELADITEEQKQKLAFEVEKAEKLGAAETDTNEDLPEIELDARTR